jgi:hypothetical protein
MRTTRSLFIVAALALLAAFPASAQRPHIGAHGGYNFDRDDMLIGAQLLLPIGPMVELYPSVDFHRTPGEGSLMGFNLDLKLRNPGQRAPFYIGGGFSMLRVGSGGATNSDTGGNVFAGVESRVGALHPYFEVRGLLNEQSAVQLIAGLNFTM